MKERKVSQEGKKNKKPSQHSEGEWVVAWGKGRSGRGPRAKKGIRERGWEDDLTLSQMGVEKEGSGCG